MARNLKALGLALVAVFALSAIAASAASAQQGTLTSDGPVTITATESLGGTNKVTAFGAEARCPGSTGTGHKVLTQAETEAGKKHEAIPVSATTFTLTPHIKQVSHNCVLTFGWIGTTDFNGCDYVAHLGETIGGVAGTYGGTTDIVCPPGKEITWTLFTTATNETAGTVACVLHIKEQKGLKGAHATDLGNGTIRIAGTVEGISMVKTKPNNDTILCQAESTTTAKLDIDVTAAGKSVGGAATAISLSHP